MGNKREINASKTNKHLKTDRDTGYGKNHSSDLDVNSTDLDSSDKYECQIETRCCFTACKFHEEGVEDEYGKGSIRRRVVSYGGARRAAYLKFKCVRDTEECTDALGRTMGVHVRALAVIGLVFMLLATCAAAPAHPRSARSAHAEKNAVS